MARTSDSITIVPSPKVRAFSLIPFFRTKGCAVNLHVRLIVRLIQLSLLFCLISCLISCLIFCLTACSAKKRELSEEQKPSLLLHFGLTLENTPTSLPLQGELVYSPKASRLLLLFPHGRPLALCREKTRENRLHTSCSSQASSLLCQETLNQLAYVLFRLPEVCQYTSQKTVQEGSSPKASPETFGWTFEEQDTLPVRARFQNMRLKLSLTLDLCTDLSPSASPEYTAPLEKP